MARGRFTFDPRYHAWIDDLDISTEAEWVHFLAMLWAARAGIPNHMPTAVLPAVVGLGYTPSPEILAELVDAGLWELRGAGSGMPYYVLDDGGLFTFEPGEDA